MNEHFILPLFFDAIDYQPAPIVKRIINFEKCDLNHSLEDNILLYYCHKDWR
jgi:hypothetical protein